MSAREKILHSVTRSDVVRRTYGVWCSVPILGAGLRKLVRTAIPRGTRLWVQVPQGLGKGLWVYADPRFDVGYTNGDYEPWLQQLLKTHLGKGDCYYDIGAHAGFFCMIAARAVGAEGTVFAIEADPLNASLLKANVARNDLEQILVREVAIWSSAGQVTFERGSDASNRTRGRVSDDPASARERISVPAVRLDDFVFAQGHRAPHLVKMDIEGGEWEALQGAQRVLNERKPKLLCEVHDAAQMGQICAYLEQFGYTAEKWKPVHPHYEDYRQLYLWAVPRSEPT